MPHLLLRLALVFATLSVWGAGPPAKPKKPSDADEQIAQQAAILGRNRLAQDPKDGPGLKLLQLALLLTPEDEVALLTLGLLEKGQPLEPIATKITEDRWLDYTVARAQELYDKELPKNDQVAPLCAVYYRTAELLRPRDEKVILGLMKLKTKGVSTALDELLSKPLDLAGALAPGAKPPAKANPRIAPEPERPAEPERTVETPAAGGRDKPPLNPAKTPELHGVGCDDGQVRGLYGTPRDKTYITRNAEYKLAFDLMDGHLTAYLHFGKCRRVERTFNYSYRRPANREQQLREWLRLDGKNPVWVKQGAGKWETTDGNYVAIESGYLVNIWEKKWYEKQGN